MAYCRNNHVVRVVAHGIMSLFLFSIASYALSADMDKKAMVEKGCVYDGRQYSEGALISVQAVGYFVIQCEYKKEAENSLAYYWKQIGYMGLGKTTDVPKEEVKK